MNWLQNLFFSTTIPHSLLLIALTIATGILLNNIKIRGISLGITWILFAGICFSHFGMTLSPEVEHFTKEFGLILFVYSIGLQVGPSFFASLRQGGLRLNMLAMAIVLLSCITAYMIHIFSGESLSTMVGVWSGAVTNTPALGAAQQTFLESTGNDSSTISLGYAVAYPLGVIGIILSMMVIRGAFGRLSSYKKIEDTNNNAIISKDVDCIDIKILNPSIDGKSIKYITKLINQKFIVSRIIRSSSEVEVAVESSTIALGDTLRVVTRPECIESLVAFIGEHVTDIIDVKESEISDLVTSNIVVTRSTINGRRMGELKIRSLYNVNITRINRAGVDLIATYDLRLQMGDRVTAVGRKAAVSKVADLLGNSTKRLFTPNLFPIFVGIFLGVLLGSVPIMFPGIPQPVKLGLAGGPLIVAILIGRYGPNLKLVTFTTTSANMMLREIGITLFLASVGLGAGRNFIDTLVNGGYMWVAYGAIITVLPLLIVGAFAMWRFKLDSNSMMGLLAGSTTDPPALAYANSVSINDKASVAYATVYPLTMFMRVLTAQILILMAIN